jgi:hypothetical protein
MTAFPVARAQDEPGGEAEEGATDSAELEALKEEILDDAAVEKRLSWALGFRPIKVRMVTPRVGPGRGRSYWYLVYEIENKAAEEHDFFLSITATGERKATYSDLFLPSVERAIEEQEGRPLWGKLDKFEKVLQDRATDARKYAYETIGAGEKRLCVAVFNRFDPNSKNLTLRVKGLTNDIAVETDPADGSTVLRERVRVVHVRRPGDEYEYGSDGFKNLEMEWVEETTKFELPAEGTDEAAGGSAGDAADDAGGEP